MPRPIAEAVYKVKFRVPSNGGLGDLAGVLDMLRYEGARIQDWGREADGKLFVKVASKSFTPDRWNSFGLYAEEVF